MKVTTHPLGPQQATLDALAPVDLKLVARLKASLDRVLRDGDRLTEMFYSTLFSRHPAVRPMFPADMREQKQKLAQSLKWVVANLSHPAEVKEALDQLGKRHVGYGAKAEHYPIVRDILVESMGRVAGTDWSNEIGEDWRVAIDLIASHMIGTGARANGAVGPG